MTRLQLVVGKGGVGKSTIAATAAAARARAGERVLVLSLDEAHSLRDVFAVDGPPQGSADGAGVRSVDWAAPGSLDFYEVDTLGLAAQRWRALTGALPGGLPGPMGDLLPEELTVVPGVQEFMGLAETADRAAEGRWDRIVVDLPASGAALRMLEAPSALSSYLERLWPRHRRLGRPPASGRALVAVGMAEQLDALSARIADLLRDRSRTSVTAVTGPGRVAASETRRILTALGLSGLAVDQVVVNRAERGAPLYRREGIQELHLPETAAEPVGPTALLQLAARLEEAVADEDAADEDAADEDAAADEQASADAASRTGDATQAPTVRDGGVAVFRESGSGVDAVYVMMVSMPFAEPRDVRVGRIGDDLLVRAGGVRRRVRLAPVLQRCTVREAAMGEGVLRIRFRPDPEEWPQ